jgi:hypothetical protein
MIVDLDYPFESKPRYGYGKPPHERLACLIERNRGEYASHLKSFISAAHVLTDIPAEPIDLLLPHWNNGFFPGLDVVALCGFMSELNPPRYVEIGSGNSTKFCHFVRNKLGLRSKIISIDPEPRAEIDVLCDRVIRRRAEELDSTFANELESGDILFIDGSHRVLMGSDVTALFLDVLPGLRPGVVVHVHDIFLPYDYPPDWSNRYYSEQYILAAYLLGQFHLEILLPNAFITYDAELSSILAPLWNGPLANCTHAHGTSFWMRSR